MRHEWVFDVLTDLHAYALRNGLPGLAAKVEATLHEAHREIRGPEAEGFGATALVFRRGSH